MRWYESTKLKNILQIIQIILAIIGILMSIAYYQLQSELVQVQEDLVQCQDFDVGIIANGVSCIGTSDGPGCVGIAQS